jgi:hypothetical protein
MTDRASEEVIFNVSILLCGSRPGDTTILHLFRDATTCRRVERLAAGASFGLRESDAHSSTCALEPPTERQLAVLRLLATGEDLDRIAEILGIQPDHRAQPYPGCDGAVRGEHPGPYGGRRRSRGATVVATAAVPSSRARRRPIPARTS